MGRGDHIYVYLSCTHILDVRTYTYVYAVSTHIHTHVSTKQRVAWDAVGISPARSLVSANDTALGSFQAAW